MVERRRIVIVGIGNTLRGDDGAGVAVVQGLQARGCARATLIDAGTAPENYLGAIARLQPDEVILIDAAAMGAAPGTTRRLAVADARWTSLSTHAASLQLCVTFLRAETQADIQLVGIQPGTRALGAALSADVAAAVAALVKEFGADDAATDSGAGAGKSPA